jgi:hypothetical protein
VATRTELAEEEEQDDDDDDDDDDGFQGGSLRVG